MGGSAVDNEIGRRLREIRSWRQLNIRAVADQSGISYGYLAKIERGEKPVNSRKVLESLANTLHVAPSGWWIGEVPDGEPRPWQHVHADVQHLTTKLRPAAAYADQAAIIPGLVRDLLLVADNNREALVALIGAYKAAAYLAHDLGVVGLPSLAVERMAQVAQRLDDPTWTTYAAYHRTQLLSGLNRARQYQLAVNIAEAPGARIETRGLAHLTAAMACAARGDADTVATHLTEATELAEQIEPDVSPWQGTNFGRINVGIWRTSLSVELGAGGKVAEIAENVHPDGVSTSRQAAFWIDYGRGLLSESRYRDRGIAALLKAERLAPQKVRSNVFAREAVADLLRRTRRDTGGRELRGLAWRMGVAPTG
jgi:transcriptional regulator with XRE-family HTH domain